MRRLDSASDEVVIRHGKLYWPGRAGGGDGPALGTPAGSSRLDNIRNFVVLATVTLYLMLNWGFQQVRIPPVAGGGLPAGEIVLIMYLATLNYTGVLGRLGKMVYLVPLVIWWIFGVGRALFDAALHGAWALRDAAHVIESLFLLVGFAYASTPENIERFFRWLPKLLIAGVIYGLLFPVRVDIWLMSPTITSGTGFEVPILGSMANTPYLMIMGAAYLMLFHGRSLWANLLAVVIIGYVVAIFQARTLYLVLIAMFGFLVLYRRSSVGNIAIVGYVSALLLALITLVGLQLGAGRLGSSFSFDFLVAHFMAIFGICTQGFEGVCSAASGVDQRLDWWLSILEKMRADIFSMLLGLGYGVPLTDFYGSSGARVREPHNSYITVIARTGIVGGICWFLLMLNLVHRWHVTFKQCVALGWREGQNRLMVLMVFFIAMWVFAIGEDGFEKPYNIIPFYFFWGVVLRFAYLLDRGEIGPEADDDDRM